MSFNLGGGGWVLLWFFGWAAWSYIEDRERNKRRIAIYDLIHKERLYAMDKGLPYPELPPYQLDEPPEEPAKPASLPWRALTGWGIVCFLTGVGCAAALAFVPEAGVRSFWPLGTIPLWIGLGLFACAWLFKRTDRQ